MLYSFSNICPLAAVLKLMLTNSVFFVCTVTRVSIFQKRSPECKNDSSVTVFLFNRDLFYVPFSFIAYSWGVFLCQFFFFFCTIQFFSHQRVNFAFDCFIRQSNSRNWYKLSQTESILIWFEFMCNHRSITLKFSSFRMTSLTVATRIGWVCFSNKEIIMESIIQNEKF